MMNKITPRDLRNPEYYQFMVSACALFSRYNVDPERLSPLCEELDNHTRQIEISLTAEKRNEKIREKNEMDRVRDRLHSRLFNYLKHILYDETDERFDDAQEVMRTLKAVGNPTKLPENAQSAMMTTLGNRLEPMREKLLAIGAQQMVDDMLEANRKFIILEQEARDIAATHRLDNVPSVSNVRKLSDPVYKSIVEAINVDAKMPHKAEIYRELVTDMNVLVDKYNALIAARKKSKTVINNVNKNL